MPNSSHTPPSIILIRHAQSQWNLENRFSGWADPPLTEEGKKEALRAASLLKHAHFTFDIAYCSYLQRTQQTLEIMLNELNQQSIELKRDWRLNERHYGTLQGKIKTAEANHTTEEQIWRWRRSYLDKAEPLAITDPRHPTNDSRYDGIDRASLPAAENLAETRARVSQFWLEEVEPAYRGNKSVLISAHGNSLRALLMDLTQMSVAEVESFEIPTGAPIAVEKTNRTNTPWQWHYL